MQGKQRNTGTSSASHKAVSLFALLLFGRKPYSLKQLADFLDCSRQTVLRLVDEIELIGGFSVQQWKEGGQNWYQLAVPSGKANISLSQNELQQLMICRDFFQHLLPVTFKNDLENAVSKAAFLADSTSPPLCEPAAAAAIRGKIDYEPFDEILRVVVTAQTRLQVLEIWYQSRANPEGRLHCFVPVRMVSFHDGLYVRGWTVNDKGTVEINRPMTLAVHRMKSITATRRYLDKDVHLKGKFPEENWYFGMARQGEPFEVVVRFFPPACSYVRERQWSKNQNFEEEQDGSVLLTLTAHSEYEVIKWVLSFGEEAELVAPSDVRKKIIRELQQNVTRYKS